ncbi:MAG: F0F1 ATP synthase subunit gamma [Thermanaeromonas sp.]|uniref:ATP synthase F1 subunit gamma n=1 Tax=Thermanaeromonas sp. TaxID=2003697 RepID=UPI00244013A9|nr:ATP synthase F1 subunit gamma [Thermanaeromonas sp.]MCG0277016.1 F0F1 ATP synthase subunit gamma [Thermanaeromonas sp.]
MPTMRDLKRRIRSIKNTQQITKAMKMVAAAKLRKIQDKVIAGRPYGDKIREVVGRLLASAEGIDLPLAQEREIGKVGYCLITADRGLAGSYNANLIRLAQELVEKETKPCGLIAVGRKGRDFFRRRGVEILAEYTGVEDVPDFTFARRLARDLVRLFLEGTVDQVYLIYSRFYSALRQVPQVVRLLPVVPPEDTPPAPEYIYEPPRGVLLAELLPRFVEIQVYRALLEAKASEHGARMTAMDNATENAAEMIDKLTLSFNRARQAAITKEIVEVVSGAEALK